MTPIQQAVAERGGVSFRDFMEMALYAEKYGYYAGKEAVGKAGDYFTSVSVGAVFGRLLGLQFREMWLLLGEPPRFTILEQGANDGAFAADVLEWSRAEAPDFFQAARYEIAEPQERLEARQRGRLEEFADSVTWRKGLEEAPAFTGVHFSNELVDAFPVHRVRFKEGAWRELWVTPELAWEERAAPAELLKRLADAPRLEGYTTEINLEALRWAEAVAGKIERGWVLTVDYGYTRDRYYAPERREGTLQCYEGHRKGIDPLARAGHCDMTASVEFTSLATAFLERGMELAGYTDQHHFLTGLASEAFAGRAPSAKEARELKTLLHPEMMGTSFRALGLSRGVAGRGLAGFRFARDAARELGLDL